MQTISVLHVRTAPALDNRFKINRPYIVGSEMPGFRFDMLEIRSARLLWSTFVECYFVGTKLSAQAGEGVVFLGGDFRGASLTLRTIDDKPITPAMSHFVAFVDPQRTDGCFVNDIPLSKWVAEAPPPPKRGPRGRIVLE